MSSLLSKVKPAASVSEALAVGFDFKQDDKATSVLTQLDLLNPTEVPKVLNPAREGFVIEHEMPMEEYHSLNGWYSSSSVASTVRLTEREVAHNMRPEVKAAKNKDLAANPFVQNGAKIHDLIEAVVKRGLREGDLEAAIERYEPLPKFKMSSKDGVAAALEVLEPKFTQAALDEFKILAADAGNTAFQQQKALVQMLVEANPYFIPEATHQYMVSLAEELQRLPHVLAMLKYAVAEASIFNHIDRIKTRPDVVIPSGVYGNLIHLSVKTTSSLDRFKASFYRNGLHIQEAMYNNEISMALGEIATSCFLLIECTPTGLVQIKLEEVSADRVSQWHAEYFDALERYKKIEHKFKSDTPARGYETAERWGVELL